jgi:hypothetical protein
LKSAAARRSSDRDVFGRTGTIADNKRIWVAATPT